MSAPDAPQRDSLDAKVLPEIRCGNSSPFEVIHCDGAVGGLMPHGFLGMSVNAERVKPPDRIVVEADEEGDLTERPKCAGQDMIRQVEATVLLSLDQAEALGRCLLGG